MLFSDTFSVGGGGSPRTPLIRTRSGPSSDSSMAVHPQRHIGIRVARAGDLVEQLGGDRVDGDRAAGAGMLGDHRRPVGVDLGEREARDASGRRFGEERVVAAGGLRTALDDVARGHRTRERVVVGRGPSRSGRRPGRRSPTRR